MPVVGAFAVPHPPIIMPEIGRGEERKIAATDAAYQEAARRCAELKPDVLVVLSPHSVLYRDYFHISPGRHAKGDFSAFGHPEVKIETDYDVELAARIAAEARELGIAAGTMGERDAGLDHGTMIPLRYFFAESGPVPVVRIGLSGFPLIEHYRFGQAIARAVETLGRRAVIIASGDLSHKLKADGPYGFVPQGPAFDEKVMDALARADFISLLEFDPILCEKAAECGHRSFVIMSGAFDGVEVKAEKLSYEGPFGVGYGVVCFVSGEADVRRHCGDVYLCREREKCAQAADKNDEFVRLARSALEYFIKTNQALPLFGELSSELHERRAGVFVSLKKFGELRGCIGTIAPVTRSIAEEIARNSVSAGTQDPRFEPVTEEELPYLVYDVDVLSPAERSDRDHLDPKRYGVIVSSGAKRGLLLPNLEGVDTVEQQLDIALRKAGIGPGELYFIERFEVVRHL